eukprot:CAMPEP_0177212608 /NCGR_PEP_ID=MMETSP0367-20130122/32726_1 /TAXON_ID=447022 ORGANISM="Scrippsiella hangoei-like, Strain SHHI-4" /NCGR_SAMPLE_ID=MMETSP0367 /ASSEMBLY_ACC=CAM_ASM_000362 /LENGTH=89 /DNA_ID=CAMNT_0018661891 /DNA_START=214 /DNA_END=483 /DNA_ORIENTATION=-
MPPFPSSPSDDNNQPEAGPILLRKEDPNEGSSTSSASRVPSCGSTSTSPTPSPSANRSDTSEWRESLSTSLSPESSSDCDMPPGKLSMV